VTRSWCDAGKAGAELILLLMNSRPAAADELNLCYALRHLGEVREILVLKIKGHDFYAFPVYALDGPVDAHNSWHESGVFHASFKIHSKRGQPRPVRRMYIPTLDGAPASEQNEKFPDFPDTRRARPAELKGVGRLLQSCLFLHQFPELSPVGTHAGELVVLDAESANFKDDAIFANVYLVAPDAEHLIPRFPYTSARTLYLEKRTAPWVAVELFQQSAPSNWHSEALREWECQMERCSDASR